MPKDKNFFLGHKRLAEERARFFATQQDAADYFGVSRVTWGQCERGNATPSGEVLAGLAQIGADVLYILTGQRSTAEGSQINADEQELLALFRAAPLAVKAAAIGALQGAAAGVTLLQKGAGVQIGLAHGPVTVGAAAPRRRKG